MIGVRVKEARKATGMSQEEVAKKLGLTKSVISKLENDKEISEDINGDLIAALSYLYNVPYSFLVNREAEGEPITMDDILNFITGHQTLSWNAKGVLFHIFWCENSEPSFNTIRQFSGDNYERLTSALNELMHYKMIFKYRIPGDIEVYGLNYLRVCESIKAQRVIFR